VGAERVCRLPNSCVVKCTKPFMTAMSRTSRKGSFPTGDLRVLSVGELEELGAWVEASLAAAAL
jgi:hypothetical protein